MIPEDWFKQIKEAYPKRSKGKGYGWPDAFKKIQERMSEGHSFEDILEGTKNYCAGTKLSGDYGTEFVKQASTFFGPGLHFLDEYETEDPEEVREYRKPEVYTDEMRQIDAKKAEENLAKLMRIVK